MLKIVLVLLSMFVLSNASDYSRSNAAAKEAFKDLDCDFGDCQKSVVEPKVIIQERVIVKEVPVEVEKLIVREKVVVKEKIVYVDRTPETISDTPIVAPSSFQDRLYNASFDIPVIGVVGSSFYSRTEAFYIEDDKVKATKPGNNRYLKSQSRAAWAGMKLKNAKILFLSNYDETIPYYKESMTQINFHVELPDSVIENDITIVALPKKSFKNSSGSTEEYSTCSFNGFTPNNSKLQSKVELNGNKYLDIRCTVVLYNYNTQTNANNEIQNMVQTESFEFIPVYRVFPPVRKGSKKSILGSSLKKFVFAQEIAE